MSDIIISTDSKKDEKPQTSENDIKEALRAADEYAKLKSENDKLEAEYNRRAEIQAKMQIGGRSLAGQKVEKTPEEEAKEEAAKILAKYR